jgi:hypothetical protein
VYSEGSLPASDMVGNGWFGSRMIRAVTEIDSGRDLGTGGCSLGAGLGPEMKALNRL